MKNNLGVISVGIKCPIIREGDDLAKIVIDSVLSSAEIEDHDVIGITESIVARSAGNYVTIDDIVQDFINKSLTKKIVLSSPIMSRNRFSLILRAFARYADELHIILEGLFDEQGNPNHGINPFTGVDIQEYYAQICKEENCKVSFTPIVPSGADLTFIDARCHPAEKDPSIKNFLTLKDIMSTPITRLDGSVSGFNSEFGLLGCNKSSEEKLKLFPEVKTSQELVYSIQEKIYTLTSKHVEVMVYGDGCFKDPVGGIWEFADPVTSPAYTAGLEGTPNEIKIKNFADDKYKDLSGAELEEALKSEIKAKNENLVGSMTSQGTTPRRYVDLLASLMDLTSGSGDKGTPIILVKNYFNNYAS